MSDLEIAQVRTSWTFPVSRLYLVLISFFVEDSELAAIRMKATLESTFYSQRKFFCPDCCKYCNKVPKPVAVVQNKNFLPTRVFSAR